jgi:hypothetical protein
MALFSKNFNPLLLHAKIILAGGVKTLKIMLKCAG